MRLAKTQVCKFQGGCDDNGWPENARKRAATAMPNRHDDEVRQQG
jgi:hypothetical protein